MNPNWKNFLLEQGAVFKTETQCTFPDHQNKGNEKQVFALPDLAFLRISGQDAGTLLQGQSTCNINEVTEQHGSFGAFCTPKGRSLCHFFICKIKQDYLLILAADLLNSIGKRLQMYVLRSDVTIDTSQEQFNLIGLNGLSDNQTPLNAQLYSLSPLESGFAIRLPGLENRFLALVPKMDTETFWHKAVNDWQFRATDSLTWQAQDIQSGIAWLNAANSDEYIPQMLNLDQLNGISFKKGCYTGQEIIARTHYKGKAKRQMYLIQSALKSSPDQAIAIIDKAVENQPVVGKTLVTEASAEHGLMLAVIQIDHAQSQALCLDNATQEHITVSEFSY